MAWNNIPGHSGFLPLYEEFVKNAEPGAVAVEVGVALGHSIAFLARRALDARKPIEIWGVDPWSGVARNGEQQHFLGGKPCPGDFTLFLEMMRTHAREELESLRLLRVESQRAARVFPRASCDLVLIDAAHDFDSVDADIQAWLPAVKPGGILAGDDHEPNYAGVEKACRKWFGSDYEVRGTTWILKVGVEHLEKATARSAVDLSVRT
jgi:Methyltransferase domain